jgi:hypothetical protein
MTELRERRAKMELKLFPGCNEILIKISQVL